MLNKDLDLKKFIADHLSLAGGRWGWRPKILEKAEEFAQQVYSDIKECKKCQGTGMEKMRVIKMSQLGSNWSPRHHLICRKCKGAGKIISEVS